MFISPYSFYSNFYRIQNPISYMRILNASTNSPALDVYLNNRLLYRNLNFKAFSDYIPLPSGTYNVTIFPSGTTSNAVFNRAIFIPPEKIWTTAVIGTYPNINILPIEDEIRPKLPHKALVKFVNLSQDSSNLNLSIQNGRTLFSNIPYRGVTDYVDLDPNTYTFNVTDSNTGNRLIYVPNIRLTPNRFYSIYTVGNASEPSNLQLLIPLDGNSYLRL
ncbi:DUF4397 domain-containing protein [Clostridium tyrobutyricum]|uniref:DUF4397 domain-containing protein n=2 Tax=Clostridium tyrobutyricum TaxID=1519 RepID=W6N4J9_CLOTY|nr:DUF4397 domain-containing protein [Clostridium tyrobutyricum]AND85169.1 hypothetical protein CTK_C19170 [Clostridium tyrobutyricum]ANP69728.1 hypothetical protein BA182_08590 [Clostridium tyrobutyricum]MBR9646942.1 DUF4397 domain-containing protein [Clostridium tyrobutyricum]MBV4415188.1 DUF4397 domain-containing protein [Clostridium tyrobutyricum]MBV4420859.1 DUF4397 domain-containing protein [Clostridium tyrobutyricum]